MNVFTNLFSGQSQQQQSASLLADWNSYAGAGDVEAGGPSGSSATDRLFSSAEQAGSKVSDLFKSSISSVQSGVTAASSSLPSMENFSIPTGQQLMYFFSFMAGGGVFLMLAFTIFLPTIILSPSKFAMSFTLGCLCIMAGFSSLRGWQQQMKHMLSRERLPFSSAYIGSILATLYAALVVHSYLLCLLCSGLQVVALLYYVMSYFPGGATGVKFMLNMLYQAVLGCFGTAQRTLLR